MHVKELPKYNAPKPDIVGTQNLLKDEPYTDHTFDPAKGVQPRRNSEESEGLLKEVVSDDTSFDLEFGDSLLSGKIVRGEGREYLNKYHKCLFALIKVLTKRLKLYQSNKLSTSH